MNIDKLVNRLETITVDEMNITPKLVEDIIMRINFDNQALGQGILGQVYPLTLTNSEGRSVELVVKINNPCQDTQSGITQHYCDDMSSNEQIIRVPYGDDKKLMIVSNYLSEGMVGGILNNMEAYTPHFIRTEALYISKFYRSSYIILQKAQPNLIDKINTAADVIFLLYQVAYSLTLAQELYKFTHYDLHIGNLVYTEPTYDSYLYKTNPLIETQLPFVVKIIDFGFSRLEYSNILLQPKIPVAPTFADFNPYYDFISLLGSIYFFGRKPLSENSSKIDRFANKIYSLLGETYLTGLMKYVFAGKPINEIIPENNWRPIVENLNNLTPIRDITNGLAKTLLTFIIPPISKTNIYESSNVSTWTPPLPRRITSLFNNWAQIDTGIFYKTEAIKVPFRDVNLTGRENRQEKDMLVHIIGIETKKAHDDGYRFKTACCKMDPLIYMENKFGVAINGGFFDIKTTYEPIGQYRQRVKDKYFESSLPLNDQYRSLYGYVYVTDNNIKIHQDIDTASTADVFMSGPILIWNGTEQITDEIIKRSVLVSEGLEVRDMLCRNPTPGTSERAFKYLPVQNTFVANCTQILPGELSHGGNPNPRSMLIINKLENVLLIVVEGRTSRSVGADFLDLVQIAKRYNAVNAINLDGGGSSNIAWRTPSDPNAIYTLYRTRSYPVGNILTLVK